MRQMAIALVILIAIATGGSFLVAHQRRRAAEPMRVALLADIDSGSCAGWRQAQALARHLLISDARDDGARSSLAFAGALLVLDCGEPLSEDVASSAGVAPGPATIRHDAEPGATMAAASLIRLQGGQRAAAAALADAAVAAGPGTPQPLYALARVRARQGDLEGASRALEAAMVIAPAFVPARVTWAEVRLDLGDTETAAEALSALPAPDLRTRLLLDEILRARRVLDPRAPAATALDAACAEPHAADAQEAAGCALRDATRARLAGHRAQARDRALTIVALDPGEPRLLARAAQLLAGLGAVDGAAALVAHAERLASPSVPALAWAGVAVALGRGRMPARPEGLAPPSPEGPLLEARAALAAGGVGALTEALDRVGARARSDDPDLDQLARLRDGARRGARPQNNHDGHDDDPVRAYVDGLRARLSGDLDDAAQGLSRALAGHGDACHAAGEYVATLRALKRKPAAEVFAPLRAENAGCVNLPR